MKRYYLAYGSNLNMKQMKWRCPNSNVIGTGWIDNYELLFKGSMTGSYLTIEPRGGSRVPVAVWEVSESDEKALDRYEGYPIFYYKKEMRIPVDDLTGKVTQDLDCFIYIMDESRPFGLPTTGYIMTCLEGYKVFGFDAAYIKEAVNKSEAMMK